MTDFHVSTADSDLEEMAKQRQAREDETIRFVARLSAGWQKEHEVETGKFERQLLLEHCQASVDEKILLHIAASDLALSSLLGECELQVAKRLRTLIDNASTSLSLARTLRQVVACRSAATDRIQQVLQSTAVLRGQRLMREKPHYLRRVA